jgi:quercetin dioxygenase-like cupin family protein
MIKTKLALALTLLIAATGLVSAQDPVKVDPTHYKTILENASVRILKVDYPAGAKSPMHSHPDAIVVSLGASKVQFTAADKTKIDSDMARDAAMYTPAGSHSVLATGTTGANAIVVEFKGVGGKAALPASREGMTLKTLAEGPGASAFLATTGAKFQEPAGTKHDFDQVVIALGPSPVWLSIDGKPVKTTWARGEVAFIGRGVPHESRNTGGKPVDLIIVAIK